MKRKFLEDLGIEKEAIDKIMAENGADVNAAKADYDELKKQLETQKKQLKERDDQLEGLKKSNGDIADLKKQISDMQTENKAAAEKHEAEMKELKLTTAIKLALGESAHDADLVSGLLDRSKMILVDDGKVSGLEEQLNTLKKEKGFLFKEKAKDSTPPGGGKTKYDPKSGDTNDGGIGKALAESMNKASQPAENPYAKSWG